MKGFLKKFYSSKCCCYKCMMLYHSVCDFIVCRCSLTTLNWLACLLMCKNDQNRANMLMTFPWEYKVWKNPSGNKYVPWSINSVTRPSLASPFLPGRFCWSHQILPLLTQISSETGHLWPLRELVRISDTSGVCVHPTDLSHGAVAAPTPKFYSFLVSKNL